jgi:choline dehydrogenase-like flavoprotein
VENCRHRPLWRLLSRIGLDFTGHGWHGWLDTERPVPHEVLADDSLMKTVIGTVRAFASTLPFALARALRWLLRGRGDPNARQWPRRSFKGVCYTPLSTRGGHRVGPRERLLEVAAAHPEHLHIETDALATRVLFDDAGNATGVEYLKGRKLYRAHADPGAQDGERRQVHVRREVILCGGAFNTPQLLMLSGIGPAEELEANGIPVRVDLPGVGRNLQDRYEVALTYRMPQPWDVLAGTTFARGDAKWKEWKKSGSGLYSSNGAMIGIVRRSAPAKTDPDLFCMAMVARFEGYFTGFSKWIREHADYLTWVVLKAHTENRGGVVKLCSADPRDRPFIDFGYFAEDGGAAAEDLRAVVEGVRFVRRMTDPLLADGTIAEELTPGPAARSDTALEDHVRDTAWGHHASCTCAMGPREQRGVLDSGFRVYGAKRLRVVDASVFPRIPGIFIVSAVYMIAEKAADVILRDARA